MKILVKIWFLKKLCGVDQLEKGMDQPEKVLIGVLINVITRVCHLQKRNGAYFWLHFPCIYAVFQYLCGL